MIGFITSLLIFGVMVIVHELGHFIMARRQGVRVECFSIGFGPCLFKKESSKTLYKINAIPFGGYVKLAGDTIEEAKGRTYEYLSKSALQRAKIVFFGPFLNYLLGVFCFWLVFFIGYQALSTKIGGLLEGYGAEKAGLKEADRIISVNGSQMDSWEDIQAFIYTQQHASEVNLVVLRGNKELEVDVMLKQKELDDNLGSRRNVGLLGITPDQKETVFIKYGFFKSILMGIKKTWTLTAVTYKALWRLVIGALSLRESVTGPIGIFYVTAKAAELGLTPVINLMGVLSISLAIFNLLPLPILDGGHLFLILLEKIRGRHLSGKVEQVISKTGIILIISFAVFVAYNDIMRFFGEKIGSLFK